MSGVLSPSGAPQALHFVGPTAGPLDEQIAADVAVAGGFSVPQLLAITTLVLDCLKSPKSTDLIAAVDKFGADNRVNPKALKSIAKSFMSLFKDSLKQGVSPAHLKEDLMALRLPEAHADAVSSLWRSQLVDLSRAAINASLQVNQLVDMDWKFGVTVASDELDQLGATFLQLKLVIDNGGVLEDKSVELSLPQFYEFLSEMEKARTYVEYLSGSA